MATTDLHMELLAPEGRVPRGLEALSPVIAQARAEVANALYFDNGDLLQGNSLGEHLAAAIREDGRRGAAPHPAMACLAALGCDAATLGNHDFGFGPALLRSALAWAGWPVVAANLRAPGLPGPQPWAVLRREVVDAGGGRHPLAIGVIGFLPPQTAAWETAMWPGLETEDVIEAARRELPRLRAAGAEIVVALSHGGEVEGPHRPGAENAARALAALPGIDAVIAGHTHVAAPPVPRDWHPGTPAPVASAGFGGSHLAVIDLALERGPGGWRLAAARAEARRATGAKDPARLRRIVAPHLRGAAARGRPRLGRTEGPLASHLSLLGIDPGLRLVAAAQRWHLRRALAGSAWEGLPILVAVAPARAGGLGGPANYTDLPPGRLRRADLAELYAFSNRLAAVEVTGRDLAPWLDCGAAIFYPVAPGDRDAPLIAASVPAYNLDLIDGLDWLVDLAPGAPRIRGVTRHGRPVPPEERFVLATTTYRLAGSGPHADLAAGRPSLPLPAADIREVIAAWLRRRRRVAPDPRPFFRFARIPGATAVFDTAPAAAPEATLPLTPVGPTPEGFLRLRLDLDP
nr:metallophosphoesterase [Paracoccus sp. S-4012]